MRSWKWMKRLSSWSTLLLLSACLTQVEQNGTVAFSSAGYSVTEDAGTVTISVSRSGGTEGAIGVDYATSDGTATATEDYAATTGTLSWGDGESGAKTFTVTVVEDNTLEGDETVNLSLSNPTGGADLGTDSALLTIVEAATAVQLDRGQAARGERVSADLSGFDSSSFTVTVAGLTATTSSASENSLDFVVPEQAPAGPQTVEISAGADSARVTLNVLGDVFPDKATLIVRSDISEATLRSLLDPLGFDLESAPKPLGLDTGPCSGQLADIDVSGTPLGQALEELKQLEEGGAPVSLHIDPRSGFDVGAVDPLNAIGADLAQAGNLDGSGVVIAVLDTGVNEHPELAGPPAAGQRLRLRRR